MEKCSVNFLLNLSFCASQKERQSYRFGTTCGWGIDDLFRWSIINVKLALINLQSGKYKHSETINVRKRFNVSGHKFIIRVDFFVHWGGLWRELNATCSARISQPFTDTVIILTFNNTCVTSLIYRPSLIMGECTRRLSSHTFVSPSSVWVCSSFTVKKVMTAVFDCFRRFFCDPPTFAFFSSVICIVNWLSAGVIGRISWKTFHPQINGKKITRIHFA